MAYIYVEESDLTWAAQQGLVQASEVGALWPALVKRAEGRGGLSLALISFYSGSLLIIGALTWFMSVVWTGNALFLLALSYVTIFGTAGVKLWYDGGKWGIPKVVGGLFVTIAVSVAPVATFALQRALNEWPVSHGILIESTAVLGGALALYFVPFPFLTAPISVGLFAMANVDLAELLWTAPTVTQSCLVSFGFGIAMDVVAFFVDKQKLKQDYSFWLYLFGTFASFGGLTWLFFTNNGLLGPYHFLYAVFSALYIVAATLVNRQSLVVFGSLGEAFYVLWLTNALFWNSWAYPFVLTGVGLLIILAGILLQKYIIKQNAADAEQAKSKSETAAAATQPYQLLPPQEMYMQVPVHIPHQQPFFFVPPMMMPQPSVEPAVPIIGGQKSVEV